MDYYNFIKKFIYAVPPEAAHNIAITALKTGLLPGFEKYESPLLRQEIFGLEFGNPVGLAAGFDKNAEVIDPLLAQGFGFIEVGTVTPRAQSGNPKPRLFRLADDEAIINRMGFNNKGCDFFASNLKKRLRHGIVGANIGKNKTSEDAVEDYVFLLKKLYGLSDYITVNISSPNTPGLRGLQNKDELGGLLKALIDEKAKLAKEHGKSIAILVKIAPDNSYEQYEDISAIVLEHKVDGLIISNTTIGGRDELKSDYRTEAGGLSGRPLFTLSTNVLKDVYRMTEGKIPLIGVGGIASGDDAYAKIRAGASLVQIYSAIIYQGFSLAGRINRRLEELLQRDGFANISDAIGLDARN